MLFAAVENFASLKVYFSWPKVNCTAVLSNWHIELDEREREREVYLFF